jgi:hypothetical protein
VTVRDGQLESFDAAVRLTARAPPPASAVNQNVLWGIDAVVGVIDLGGNTATGNGAGQCRNVTC